ncbi:MAG: sigma-70 family RNA polymerase sigma factor [Pirellulales bacterium]|nr:sigma-70 family RNA polymerase sigma factor [Pirellulales bacterium]
MEADRLAGLVDAHAAALELFAARWTSWPQDCVQEAFIELARQPEEPHSVSAWLFRVVRNRALNAARFEQRRRQREQTAARLRPVSGHPCYGDSLDATDACRALETLDPSSYEIIVLRIWGQLSFPEISEVLGCSISSAHRRYGRALEELRRILELSSCPTKINSPKN